MSVLVEDIFIIVINILEKGDDIKWVSNFRLVSKKYKSVIEIILNKKIDKCVYIQSLILSFAPDIYDIITDDIISETNVKFMPYYGAHDDIWIGILLDIVKKLLINEQNMLYEKLLVLKNNIMIIDTEFSKILYNNVLKIEKQIHDNKEIITYIDTTINYNNQGILISC